MPYDIQHCPIRGGTVSFSYTHYHRVDNYEIQYATNPKTTSGWATFIIHLSFTDEGQAYYSDCTDFIKLDGIQPVDKARADTLFLLRQ